MKILRCLASSVLLCLLTGCLPKSLADHPVRQAEPKYFAVFFDGTENNGDSGTNVSELHTLMGANRSVTRFYIEGVGMGGKKLGSGTGWGIEYRTVQAYAHLLRHYRPGDQIAVFGFSRGAFSARMLTALLYYAGIPPIDSVQSVCQPSDAQPRELTAAACYEQIASQIYLSYKGQYRPEQRVASVAGQLRRMGLPGPRPVPVEFLGVWDTVEALGVIESIEAVLAKRGVDIEYNPGERNKRYGDQLCNVRRARHALSIDDNRANIFTPRLLTLDHVKDNCVPGYGYAAFDDPDHLVEMWFSGAHSNVGGNREDLCKSKDKQCLANISLSWMTRELAASAPRFAVAVQPYSKSDIVAAVEDPERDMAMFYKRVHRPLEQLANAGGARHGRRLVHVSVIERLALLKPEAHEYSWESSMGSCFEAADPGYRYIGAASTPPGGKPCWFVVGE